LKVDSWGLHPGNFDSYTGISPWEKVDSDAMEVSNVINLTFDFIPLTI
jgi:hypothetical protein